MSKTHMFIGEKFISEGFVSEEEVLKAVLEQKGTKEKLGEALLRMGLIKENDFLEIISDFLGVRYKRINIKEISSDTINTISKDIMKKYTVFPLIKMGKKLSLATTDPTNKEMIAEIEKLTNFNLLPVLALKREIEECINNISTKTEKKVIGDSNHEYLGERFVNSGFANHEDIYDALTEQKGTNEKLGEALLRMGIIKEDDYLKILSEYLGSRYKRLNDIEIDEKAKDIIPYDIMKKHTIFPIKKFGNKLTVAMVDPMDINALAEIENVTKCLILPVLGLRSEIEKLIANNKGAEEVIEEELLEQELFEQDFTEFDYMEIDTGEKEKKEEEEEEKISEESAPVVKAVNSVILNAVNRGASDIHIEPEENKIRVRYRIDGVLKEVLTLPKKISSAVASRIKILSDLDIAEKRLPQDGRFRIKKDGNDIDFRVSILPTAEGEKVVLRILDKGNLKLDLKDLGFEAEELEKFNKALDYPYGIVLVTGPTGSGKTTTLYSALNRLNTEDVNIVTAEDPIEYKLRGINQVNCRSNIGFDFAASLRTFLRQDPDIIMVGEIRDSETAEIAVKASLTGHLVLSTIHTNDAPSTVQRLINMEIEPFLIASSLILVQAQRLGRRLCSKCKAEDPEKERYIKLLSLNKELYKDKIFYKGTGCEACNGTGYKGRVGFYEIMFIDDELRELIAAGKNTEVIRATAKKNGMRTLREQAVLKALNGITSLEEVLKNTV